MEELRQEFLLLAVARIDQEGHMASSQRQRDVTAWAILQHRIQNSHVGRLCLEPRQRFSTGRKRSSDPIPAVLQPEWGLNGKDRDLTVWAAFRSISFKDERRLQVSRSAAEYRS